MIRIGAQKRLITADGQHVDVGDLINDGDHIYVISSVRYYFRGDGLVYCRPMVPDTREPKTAGKIRPAKSRIAFTAAEIGNFQKY